MKENNLRNKIYITVSILFAILIVIKGIMMLSINNPLYVKIIDYSFWYFFGMFSAFFVIRRIELKKKNNINTPFN